MSSLVTEILKYINRFRENPKSVEKECSLFQIILSRLKPNDPFLEEINSFIAGIPTISKMQKLSLNKILTRYAETELTKYKEKPDSFPPARRGKDCYGLVSDSYLGENPGIIYDFGAEGPSNVCQRILLKREDKNKEGRYILCTPEYTQIGIAAESVDGELCVILIMANNYTEDVNIIEEELAELKQAFDLFDYHNEGRIRVNETLDSMKELQMDVSDPGLYEIMKEFSDNLYVSWPKFAEKFTTKLTDRKTDKGLKDMFRLFIDNIEQDKMTIGVLQKICKNLGIKKTEGELMEIIFNATRENGEISFETFCEAMKEVNN